MEIARGQGRETTEEVEVCVGRKRYARSCCTNTTIHGYLAFYWLYMFTLTQTTLIVFMNQWNVVK